MARVLAVDDLRLARARRDAVLALHAVDDDLEVELAHPGDDRLAGVGVVLDPERRIFFNHLAEREVEALLGRGVLGFDRLRDHRLVGVDALEQDRRLRIAQRVAGGRILEAGCRDDLAGDCLVEPLALGRVNSEQARDLLLLVRAAVQDLGARLERAAEHAHEHDLAALVHRDLECERRERLVVLGHPHELLARVARIDAGHRRHVGRRRQVVDHRVEQRMDALVAERRAREHGHHLHGDRRLADRRLELGLGEVLAVEIRHRDRVVEIGERLDHLIARIGGDLGELGRNLGDVGHVGDLAREHDRLHRHEVDAAGERVFGSDRQLHRHRVRAESLADVCDDRRERRADPIELVDEREPRHAELVGLVPDRLRLGLDARDAAEHHDRAVEHAQRALDLDREVDVTRRIDQVDLVLLPLERGGGGGDRDPALPLLLHPVHLGLAVVDLADLVDLAGVKQEPLRDRRLAGIDVGDHAQVADQIDLRHRFGRGIARNHGDLYAGDMRALVGAVAASLVTLTIVRAQPAPQPDFEKAKGLYADGNAELAVGRYADAIRDFNGAYDITHDPVLFFKIGNANEKAGRCDVALIYYSRYVREANPEAKYLDMVKDRVTACGGDPRNLGNPTPVAAPPVTPPETNVGSGSAAPETVTGAGSGVVTLGTGAEKPRTHVNGHDGEWLMIGGALAFITAGVVLAYSASSSEQDVRDLYVGVAGITPTYDATTAQRYQELLDEGHRYQYLSWGAFGVAAGFAIGAAIWFIHDRNEQALAITPVATPQGGSVSATVRF